MQIYGKHCEVIKIELSKKTQAYERISQTEKF